MAPARRRRRRRRGGAARRGRRDARRPAGGADRWCSSCSSSRARGRPRRAPGAASPPRRPTRRPASSGRWPGSTSPRAARTRPSPRCASCSTAPRPPTAPATCRWRWPRCWPRPATPPERATLVAAVLAADPPHVAALKLRARMAIDADQPGDRRSRTCAPRSPRRRDDPEIMTSWRWPTSAPAAASSPASSWRWRSRSPARRRRNRLRYARFLMQDKRPARPRAVVVDALRRAPENPALLEMLGRIHLARHDWARAGAGGANPARAGGPRGRAMADEARDGEPARPGPHRRDRSRCSRALAGSDGGERPRRWRIWCRPRSTAGDLAARRAAISTACWRRTRRTSPRRLLRAGLDQLRGDAAAAEAGYRAVIADAPPCRRRTRRSAASSPARAARAEALAALDAGLAAAPDSAALRLRQGGAARGAGRHRRRDRRSTRRSMPGTARSPVLANNLASLHRQLPRRPGEPRARLRHRPAAARLERAVVPGHLRLDPAPPRRRRRRRSATSRPAAAALPDNALVQFHLAETELALDRGTRRAPASRAPSPPPRPAARCRRRTRRARASPRSTLASRRTGPKPSAPRQGPGPARTTPVRRLGGPAGSAAA